jgi:hypothetical protein
MENEGYYATEYLSDLAEIREKEKEETGYLPSESRRSNNDVAA